MVSLKELADQPWFHSVETEASGRVVVYVKYMDKEVLTSIPDNTEDGRQIVVHFAGAKLATREMFTNNPNAPGATLKQHVPATEPIEDESDKISEVDELTNSTEEDKSLSHLISELDKLERQCGSNTLQDIFYEVHDAKNAVTDWSKRYPDVRKSLEKLYQQYGFDVIYEEMDG